MPLLPDGTYVLPGTPADAVSRRRNVWPACKVCGGGLTVGQMGAHAVCTDMWTAFRSDPTKGKKHG